MLCTRCAGNGEIVIDHERYLHAHEGDVGDEAVDDCPDCDGSGLEQEPFGRWIEELNTSVIEAEYGYEPGEFSVSPSDWEHLYREGLSPLDAFKRALRAADDARKAKDATVKENRRRIDAEEARYH